MAGEISRADGGESQDALPSRRKYRELILLIAIVAAAAVARLFQIGKTSLWYDEVVTMRLARTDSLAELLTLLNEIDATRAPLHPILLQGWVEIFGPSDVSGRAFSCLCGILTVALVYWVGLKAFDGVTGLWASWLCAVSPLLVYYSRETRMYSLLVLVTCLAWGYLFAHARSPGPWRLGLYGLCLIALGYVHPLGLLMAGTIGLAAVLFHRAFGISKRGWLFTHGAVVLGWAPWLPRYFDHEPESVTGPLSLRFLVGTPIGFIGGNFFVLFLCLMLIAYGLCVVQKQGDGRLRVALERAPMSVALFLWLAIPPLALFVYSRVAQPLFGPARYTLFVAPAYLILVARGLAKLPVPQGVAAAAGAAVLSAVMLWSTVYRADLRADWREAAAYLDRRDTGALVAVISADPLRNVEFESARYYFRAGRVVIPCPASLSNLPGGQAAVWVSVGLRDGQPIGALPKELAGHEVIREVVDFPGLRLMRIDTHGREI
jgi:4-amino-4-deoxy-L-arabinose transferase-like glycosyltransferase